MVLSAIGKTYKTMRFYKIYLNKFYKIIDT